MALSYHVINPTLEFNGYKPDDPVKYPLVTFSIPCYNTKPKYLRTMLDSVLFVAENYPASEIVVWNDGSPNPDVAKLFNEYAAENPNLLRVVNASENRGIHYARQMILSLSRGKYTLSFDSDDVMVPFDLKAAVRYMEAHPEIMATYCRKYFFNTGNFAAMEADAYPYSPFLAMFQMVPFPNGALINTERMRQCGAYCNVMPKVHDDVALFKRLAVLGRCEMVSEPRCLARHHENHSSRLEPDDEKCNREFTVELVSQFAEPCRAILDGRRPACPAYLAAGLTGALFYLNQRDAGIVSRVLNFARHEFADDYAARAIYMLCNRFRSSLEFFSEAEKAITDFADIPPTAIHYLYQMLCRGARHRELKIPEAWILQMNSLSEQCQRFPDRVMQTLEIVRQKEGV